MEQPLVTMAITGEGSTDYGKRDYLTKEWLWGPIAKYVSKIAEERNTCVELKVIEREEIKDYKKHNRLQRTLKGLEGKAIPARLFVVIMKERGFTYGIFYSDTDKETSAKNTKVQAQKRFMAVHDEIKNGLIDEDIVAIPMVALRMIESWLLGDKNAIEQTFNTKIKDKGFPSEPELLWGSKDDPESNYPKHVLRRIISNSDKKYKDYQTERDDLITIAENSDIGTLRKSCDISFEAFYHEYNLLLDNIERQKK